MIWWALVLTGTWVLLLLATWAFIAGAKEVNEAWDRSTHDFFDGLRRDAEARSMAFSNGDAESSREPGMGHKMELRTGRILPTGEIRWPGRETSAPEDSVWTRGASDPRRHNT